MTQDIFGIQIQIPEAFESFGKNADLMDVNQVLGFDNDEQGVFLEYALANLDCWLDEIPEKSYFLEPGFGSGILGLVALKQFEQKFRQKNIQYFGIDPNPSSTTLATENAQLNQLSELCTFQTSYYNFDSLVKNSSGLIFQNPPYHTVQSQFQDFVQLSCSGGNNGQRLLVDHLIKSSYHLATNGVLLGIVSCRGDHNLPEFLTGNNDFDIRNFFPEDEITWIPIHQSLETEYFLDHINEGRESAFVKESSQKWSKFHVGLYEIKRNKKGGNKPVKVKNFDFKLACKYGINGWGLRLDNHKEIQKQAYQKYKQMFEIL